jgi:hypothetical protein
VQAATQQDAMASRSRTYALFERAMRLRKPMACMYGGRPRELCPIILGHSTQGEEKALTYQFGGESSSGLPRGGEWRCLWLAKASDVQLRDGPWIAGSTHTQPQGCVAIVDLDVNPSSPYQPKRSIEPPRRSGKPPKRSVKRPKRRTRR